MAAPLRLILLVATLTAILAGGRWLAGLRGPRRSGVIWYHWRLAAAERIFLERRPAALRR